MPRIDRIRGIFPVLAGWLLALVGLDLRDLDGDLAAVGGGVLGLVADLQAEDGRAERALLAVDREVGSGGDLTVADEEHALVARDRRGDDGAGLDHAVALRRRTDGGAAQEVGELDDAGLDLALLL